MQKFLGKININLFLTMNLFRFLPQFFIKLPFFNALSSKHYMGDQIIITEKHKEKHKNRIALNR